MENLKHVGLTAALLLLALIGGDLYLAWFGTQAVAVVGEQFGFPGVRFIEFFAIWFFIDIFLSTIIVNQWVAATETATKAEAAAILTRRAATTLFYKLALGPATLGMAHGIAYFW